MTWQELDTVPLVDENGLNYWDEEPYICDVWAKYYNNGNRRWEFRRFTNVKTFINTSHPEKKRAWYPDRLRWDEDSIKMFYQWEILFWTPIPLPPQPQD
jgi:hypothetical protein